MLKTAALLVLGSMLTTIIVSVRSPDRPGPASPPTSSTFNLPRSCAQGASSAPLSGAEAPSAGAPGTLAGTIGAGAASDGSAGSEGGAETCSNANGWSSSGSSCANTDVRRS